MVGRLRLGAAVASLWLVTGSSVFQAPLRAAAQVSASAGQSSEPRTLAEDAVIQVFRQDAPRLVTGVVLVTIGLAGVVLFGLWRRSMDAVVLYFALFVGLYGLRLLTYTATTSRLLALDPAVLMRIEAGVTYVINLPMVLFVERLLGPGWRGSIVWLRHAWTVFAIAGVFAAWLPDDPSILMTTNNVLVVAGIVVVAGHYRSVREIVSPASFRVLAIGIGTLGAFALNNNLAGLGLIPWGESPEAIGFVVFIASLGYVVARRQLDARRQLIAIEQELRTARSIQESILPRTLPRLAGLELAARYVPMTAIGGDFYEFLKIDERRLGLLIADVSGHGVPAALIASMVKVAISAQTHHADAPARVLAGMNQALCGKLERQFVTASYVFVDLEAGRLRFANAGHPPALLCRARDRSVVDLAASGLMMGVFPDTRYDEADCAVAEGDRLLLYTDGVIEARDAADDFFDPEGLRAFAHAHERLSAEEFGTALLAHLSEWSGRSASAGFDDDVTIVSARFVSSGGSPAPI